MTVNNPSKQPTRGGEAPPSAPYAEPSPVVEASNGKKSRVQVKMPVMERQPNIGLPGDPYQDQYNEVNNVI